MKRITFIGFAVKNLKRHRLRTLLTVTGIAVAALTLFAVLSFNAGYDRALKDEVAGTGIHLFVSTEGCPVVAATMLLHGAEAPRYIGDDMLELVTGIEGVKNAAGFLIFSAASERGMDLFYGVTDGYRELKPGWKLEGRWFEEPDQVVLGAEVAEVGRHEVGEEMTIKSVGRSFGIAGILEKTGGDDDGFVYMQLDTAQELFEKQGKLSAVGVQLDDISRLDQVKGQIEKIPEAYVIPAEDLTSRVMEMVGGTKAIMLGISLIVLLVSGIGIFNTVLMATNERSEEFGYLRCIGARRGHLIKLITFETLLLSTGGAALGLAAGFLSTAVLDGWIRNFLPYVPAGKLMRPDLLVVLVSASVVTVVGLAAGLYPGFRASRVSPMEASRNG